jgi:uncharacterized DUF497 family protein
MAGKELEFEWDAAKARINLAKHRVSFPTASAIFLKERLERIDDRKEYGEVRWGVSRARSIALYLLGAVKHLFE